MEIMFLSTIVAYTQVSTHMDYKRTSLRTQSSKCSEAESPTLHGNGVLTGTVKLYNIFIGYSDNDYKIPYQNNKASSTAGIAESFARGFSGSAYADILSAYNAATKYEFIGNAFYNIPTSVTSVIDYTMNQYVMQAIQNMSWAITDDANTVFNVIFRGDINYFSRRTGGKSWNTEWCGYHSAIRYSYRVMSMTYVGDEAFVSSIDSRRACMPQFIDASSVLYEAAQRPLYFHSPNKNPTADALISIYAHELIEAVTDVEQQGWYRNCDYLESADICAWKYDFVHQSDTDGSHYNVQFGSNKYLIQTNWVIKANGAISGCVLHTMGIPLQYATHAVVVSNHASAWSYEEIIVTVGVSIIAVLLLCVIYALLYYCYLTRTHGSSIHSQNGRRKRSLQPCVAILLPSHTSLPAGACCQPQTLHTSTETIDTLSSTHIDNSHLQLDNKA